MTSRIPEGNRKESPSCQLIPVENHEKSRGSHSTSGFDLPEVEDNGLEPMTYALPARRSPN